MPTCVFRVQPNTLLSLWYTIGCTLLNSWLLYLAFVRYRLYTDMQWPAGAFPRVWLTAYISLLGTCIPILALFLVFGLMKTGNLAGDNDQLGARPKRTIELIKGGMGNSAVRHRNSNAYRLCHCLRSAWLHAPPAPQCLHVLLALLQLFVQQTMLAQLYRWGFINSGDFLNTELDWLLQRARQLATNLPMGETRLQSFRISTEELSASPVAPNILPILMHTRLFGIPLEFVNFLIALVAFSTVYPSVFWRVSKPFALLFTAFLGVHSLCLVWTYLGFSVLFRVQETNFYGGRPVGMGQYLWALRGLPLYHPLAIVASFWLTVVLMHVAPVALYSFGYGKFAATQNRLLRMRRSPIASANGGGGGCAKRDNGMIGWSYGREIICDGYTPHVLAIVLLLTIAAIKAPAFYAIGLIYQKEERPLLLWCLVADLVYLFSWILLWLLCTVKCRWDFRVHYDAHELIGLQDAHKTADGGHAVRGRAPGELKGALLLVHGADLFVTDDPVAKPAIMRQVLKSCLPAEDLPAWLRGAVPTQNSVPNTHSPQRRFVRAADYGPAAAVGISDIGYHTSDAYRTPELGHRQTQQHFGGSAITNNNVNNNITDDSPPESMDVPLAAPPYQRMASLPPVLPAAGHSSSVAQMPAGGGGGGGINFGTNIQQQQQQQRPYQLYHHHHHTVQQQHQNVMPMICGGSGNSATNGNAINGNANNDYAAFVFSSNNNYGDCGQQQQQHQKQVQQLQQHQQHQSTLISAIGGTISRNANATGSAGTGGHAVYAHATATTTMAQQMPTVTTVSSTTAALYGQQQQKVVAPLHQHGGGGAGLESYATIGRRCSKSSVCSAGFGSGGGAGTTGGGAASAVPPTMPSPQLLRPKRSASVQAARGEQPHYVPIVQQHQLQQQRHNNNNHQQQNRNNDTYVQHNIYGQFNGGGTGMAVGGTLQRNGIGGALSANNGGGTQNDGAQMFNYNNNSRPKLLTPVLQRHHRGPMLPQSTFATANGAASAGGWHTAVPSSTTNMTMAPVENGGAGTSSSLNGGGTTTPSSSVTIGGDSRVASAASNASSSAAASTAYGGDIGTLMNGIGTSGGMPSATTTDCATLTRKGADEWRRRNGRDLMAVPLPVQGKHSGTDTAGDKMGVPPQLDGDGTERFATSVV
ncbi:hypothetical protein niasHT_022195 [Heterodera trifolii]|uniref:Protein tincar n=1 Tax=Heterodera trifolii TaxID=157864 RepID=A0ABD2JVU8_9BILA